ncbi:MAG: ABC transporter substrate-binding protein, partial [Chloroflexota bacterium]
MLKIKAAKPDALFVWQHEEQAILITKSMAEHKIDVPCIESYGTFLNAPVIKAVGQLKEGWFEISLWNEYMAKEPWVMELAKDFKAHSGAELDAYSAQALQSLYVLADALERAASRDPEAIRNALAATKIKKGDKAFICGYPIEFDASGQNQKAFTAVNQTWEGKIHPMYPADAAAMEPGYKPVWKPTWAWLKK